MTVRQPANLGLILPSKSYDIPADARSVEVEVQANVQYTVSVSADWIKQTGSKGLTSTKLTFSVEENTTYDARSATITIKPQAAGMPEQVVIEKQAQKDALIVGNTGYDMPYGGGEIEVKVDANVSFEVKSGADWIQHLDTKALSSSTVRLKVEENPTFASREGKVEISQKGGGLSYTLTVKQAGRVAVTEVTLNSTALSLVEGETTVLTATVKPDNATDKSVAWSSDKPEVATVDGAGIVTAIAGGTAKITATAGGKSATCTVTVETRTIKVGDKMEVPAEGGTFEIDIEYNTDFTVEVEQAAQSWITFIQTKAMTSGKLQFSFAANEGTDPRSGKVTVRDKSGKAAPVTMTFTQAGNEEAKIKAALMKIYDAMNGPQWTITKKWDVSQPLENWEGVRWNKGAGELELYFDEFGLKGAFPDCFADLASLKTFFVKNEPGVSGTLPSSFNKLKNLDLLVLNFTSMTSLSDVFKDIPLVSVIISGNTLMTVPLPETLGGS